MKNQDPTANTDPNEYINQLVQVNSLEQLISINQTLTTDLPSKGSTGSGISASVVPNSKMHGQAAAGAAQSQPENSAGADPPPAPGAAVPTSAAIAGSSVVAAIGRMYPQAQRVDGNLSIPAENDAARRLADSLDGHARAPAGAIQAR